MSEANEIINAVIESAFVGFEDHGLLTVWLMLDYGGSGQGFGGHCLGSQTRDKSDIHSRGDYCGHFITRCLQIGGVNKFDQLPGRTIRVKRKGFFSPIEAIGHIVKDDWFNPTKDFEPAKESEAE